MSFATWVLGSMATADGRCSREIHHRMNKDAFNRSKEIMSGGVH